MIKQTIYLDYHSTTPVDPRVAEKVMYYMIESFGNSSSIDHCYGDEASKAVKEARRYIAELVNASPREIIFTSGATESINLAIQGHLRQNSRSKSRLIVSPVEHKAVLDTCEAIAAQGYCEVVWLKVDSRGCIDLEYLENVCNQGASLLCIMAANNEIGTIYPLEQIGQIARQYNIPFLCDGSQAVGKIPINFKDWGITYLAISAHKLYGPKGSGALVVRQGYCLEPIIRGGGHQKGVRSGTLNVPGIVGLGEACRLRLLEMEEDEWLIGIKRDLLQQLIQAKVPDVVFNGDLNNRLAGNLHLSIPGVPSDAIIARIRSKVAISRGAACSLGIETPSHVLKAIGLSSECIEGSLRIGLGKFTTEEEVNQAALILLEAILSVCRLL